MNNNYTPTILSIAGSDNYGGAGIQVDSKTIHTLGGYTFTCITALTAQNSTGVKVVEPTNPNILQSQLESILDDIEVDAVKIGMLVNTDIIEVVTETIHKYNLKNIVLDPILISTSGKVLLDPSSINNMISTLFPIVDLVTPNIPEINTLLDSNYLGKEDEIKDMAKNLLEFKVKNILIKGGHSTDKNFANDYLISQKLEITKVSTPRLSTTHTHGTGCILSSAIATHLASGYDMKESIELSKAFLYKSIKESSTLKFNYKRQVAHRKEPIL